jgi:hypothetical protein
MDISGYIPKVARVQLVNSQKLDASELAAVKSAARDLNVTASSLSIRRQAPVDDTGCVSGTLLPLAAGMTAMF